MDSLLQRFCFFFFIVVVSSKMKWPCVFDMGPGLHFDLRTQTGNTSNSNPRQPYVIQSHGGIFTHTFYLCESLENPFAVVPTSNCTENTQICLQYNKELDIHPPSTTIEFDDIAVGEGPPRVSFVGDRLVFNTTSDTTPYCKLFSGTFKSQIDLLCPYNYVSKKNNDIEIDLVGELSWSSRRYCPHVQIITLYIDSACVGPLCCTYQDVGDSFNVFSLCAENTCPSLSGYSLTHTSNLNGLDCSSCEPYFDDAKCCMYANENHGKNEKINCELSGACPSKDGERILVGEFPTTSIEYCQIIQDFNPSSSGKIGSSSSCSSSYFDSSFYYFFVIFVVVVVGVMLVLAYLYSKKMEPQMVDGEPE